jgi:protoporphyrinogen oxidase
MGPTANSRRRLSLVIPPVRGRKVVCIGAGPAGLTAAYLLSKHGYDVTVLERDPTYVGGISKTACYKGFHFDIGGHRFFSKSEEVEALWTELLGPDFLERPRKSRIYYRGKLFHYPLRAADALRKLGMMEAIFCMSSYLRARLRPIARPDNFEEWATNQFGRRLYEMFFRTYTEKVWGMKCTEISADWAAQRIKGLSLATALWNALFDRNKSKARSEVIKTLINHFRYPRRGPGMVWDAAAERIRANGGRVVLGLEVVQAAFKGEEDCWTITAREDTGAQHQFTADHVISSAAIRDLVSGLDPSPTPAVRQAAQSLRYRDFVVVALIVKDRGVFDDNWIYVHDPNVQVGRIQNFKSWSPEMVPDPARNCYGLEYFCFEDDSLWAAPDSSLIDLARKELIQLGLASHDDILDGCVIRQQKAYPVYDSAYQANVAVIREAMKLHYPNLHLVGRNGMHKYNNQDHAMMTAMLTVRNILAGKQIYDVWAVNQDAEYHEAGEAGAQSVEAIEPRLVPRRVESPG